MNQQHRGVAMAWQRVALGRLLLTVVTVLTVLGGCAARKQAPRPTTGGLFGLVRDRSSGEALPAARVELLHVAGDTATIVAPDERGSFEQRGLAPGSYNIKATFASQSITVQNIRVDVARSTPVDLAFDLGFDGDITVQYDDLVAKQPVRYKLGDGTGGTGKLEVVVLNASDDQRLAGITVFITAAQLASPIVLQTDAQGRAISEPLQSGIYDLSAYYTEVARGSIEQRKGGIAVSPGEITVTTFPIEVPTEAASRGN